MMMPATRAERIVAIIENSFSTRIVRAISAGGFALERRLLL